MGTPLDMYAFIGSLDRDRIWYWNPLRDDPGHVDYAIGDRWKKYVPVFEGIRAVAYKVKSGAAPDVIDDYIFLGPAGMDHIFVVPPWHKNTGKPAVQYAAGQLMSLAQWQTRARASRDRSVEAQGSASTPVWVIVALAWFALKG